MTFPHLTATHPETGARIESTGDLYLLVTHPDHPGRLTLHPEARDPHVMLAELAAYAPELVALPACRELLARNAAYSDLRMIALGLPAFGSPRTLPEASRCVAPIADSYARLVTSGTAPGHAIRFLLSRVNEPA